MSWPVALIVTQHFVRATPEHLVVGAGAGQFGLYLDSSLYQVKHPNALYVHITYTCVS